MFFNTSEMHIELMQVLQQGAQRRSLGHLGEGVDCVFTALARHRKRAFSALALRSVHILGEALATIAILAIGARHVGVRVVDVARKQYARVHLAPVGPHLLAVFAAGVEVGDLVGAKHVVHILGKFCLQRGHDGKLLTHEDLGEQLVCAREDHGLLLEVLDMRALGEELGHVAHLVAGLHAISTLLRSSLYPLGGSLMKSLHSGCCVPTSL